MSEAEAGRLLARIEQGSEDHVSEGGDWDGQVADLTAVLGKAILIMTPAQRRELEASEEVQEVLAWSAELDAEERDEDSDD